MSFWVVWWASHNRLDGWKRFILWDDDPRLFRTRREAREFIEQRYGYIRNRADLRAEPHGWRVPRAVKVEVVQVNL